jgi:SAM-dependent methyltransferase
MSETTVEAWKTSELALTYLSGVRGALPMADQQLAVMLRLIGLRSRPVHRFLDLGCGSGLLGAAILERHPAAQGVFLDFSRPMLAQAQATLESYGPQLTFVLEDYGDLGWLRAVQPAAPFDVIVSGYSIHHQPDPRKWTLYAELYDLLWPGGVLVNVEHVASATPRLEALFAEVMIDALHAHHLAAGGRKSREEVGREYYHRPDKAANLLAPVEVQCGWLRNIGYEDVDCYFKYLELAVFGGWRPEA